MTARIERPSDYPHVALVTIDRPEKANSLDLQTIRELACAWHEIAEDDEVRAAILTGTGDRVFCAGMDFETTLEQSRRLARGEKINSADFDGLRDAATALLAGFDLNTPLISAINGHARAGGFDLMLASEIRYAVPHATFALEEVALGLYPTGNSTVLLPRQIPWVHAHELLLTAKPINAEKAVEIGLINQIIPAEELLKHSLETAARIAANAPLAVRETRRGVREIIGMPLAEAYTHQEALGRPLRKTADAEEGARAFTERRKPEFKGY